MTGHECWRFCNVSFLQYFQTEGNVAQAVRYVMICQTSSLSGFVIGLAMCKLKLVSLKPLMPVALQCDSNKDLTRLSLRQSQSTSLADYTGAYSHFRALKTASAGILHRPPALLDTGAGICNVTVCQASGLNFSQPLRVKCGQGRMAHQPPALP